jgi:hypothetical protein
VGESQQRLCPGFDDENVQLTGVPHLWILGVVRKIPILKVVRRYVKKSREYVVPDIEMRGADDPRTNSTTPVCVMPGCCGHG